MGIVNPFWVVYVKICPKEGENEILRKIKSDPYRKRYDAKRRL